MAGSLLLDTSVVVGLVNGDREVAALLRDAERVFVPAVALGELYYGAFKSRRRQENLTRIDAMAEGRAILGCDRDTARHYGRIKNELRAKGRPIPENDMWIAAIAAQHGLTLLSPDDHFRELEALDVVILPA